MTTTKGKKKKITWFRPVVLSKNHSCDGLRRQLDRTHKKRVVVRLGSTTEREADVHINTTRAVRNSSSKPIMKGLFRENDVNQAEWCDLRDVTKVDDKSVSYDKESIKFPVVAKKYFGKQGEGMFLIRTKKDWDEFTKKVEGRYIIEKFYNYSREYRIHISELGEIMSWRKLRRNDATERWFFNSHNCNWVGENHESFNRPSNWEEIVEHCSRALKATMLDIGACDVRVNKEGKFIICEINSAPALGEQGVEVYKEHLNKLIKCQLQKLDA